MRIHANIRYYREKSGMLQSDLGKLLGISAQAISKWEVGRSEPDIESILKMCDLFNITADELLGRDDKQTKADGDVEKMVSQLQDLSPEQKRQILDYAAFLRSAREQEAALHT